MARLPLDDDRGISGIEDVADRQGVTISTRRLRAWAKGEVPKNLGRPRKRMPWSSHRTPRPITLAPVGKGRGQW